MLAGFQPEIGMRVGSWIARRRRWPRVGFSPIAVAVLIYLIFAPVLTAALSSFRSTQGVLPFETGSRWSLANYTQILSDPGSYALLLNTLIFSFGSLAIGFSVAIALGWLVERTDMPLRTFVFTMLLASLGVPGVISGVAWGILFNPVNGFVNLVLRGMIPGTTSGPVNIYTMAGLIVAQGVTLVPVTFLLVTGALKTMDVTAEEAGIAAGASRFAVIRRVTVPMLTPALASAFVFQFINVVASFELPLIIGLPGHIHLLSTQIYLDTQPVDGLPNFGASSVWSILLLIVTLLPLLYYIRLISRAERFATVTGRGYRAGRIRLGRGRIPALVFVGVVALFVFILPVLAMIWTSLEPYVAPPSMAALGRVTFKAYGSMVSNPTLLQDTINTVIIGIATAVITMALALAVGWIIVRARTKLRGVLDVLSFVPAALPGVTIGLSILLFYLLVPGVSVVYGTIWIIVIGLTTQSISVAVRLMTASIVQVDRELEEAGHISGAEQGRVLRSIVLPLVRPAVINGLLLILLTGVNSLTVPLLLSGPGNGVLSTAILGLWNAGFIPQAAAIGTVMVIVTVPISLVLRRFSTSGDV